MQSHRHPNLLDFKRNVDVRLEMSKIYLPISHIKVLLRVEREKTTVLSLQFKKHKHRSSYSRVVTQRNIVMVTCAYSWPFKGYLLFIPGREDIALRRHRTMRTCLRQRLLSTTSLNTPRHYENSINGPKRQSLCSCAQFQAIVGCPGGTGLGG